MIVSLIGSLKPKVLYYWSDLVHVLVTKHYVLFFLAKSMQMSKFETENDMLDDSSKVYFFRIEYLLLESTLI